MGSGYRTFTAGEVLTASNVQDYLMDQSVMVFADSTARATNIGTANFEEGMVSYLEDSDTVEVYDGSAWASIAPTTNQGLTLINTTSFSAVSSVSLPASTFTSTYENYLIKINFVNSNTIALRQRLRASGTDNTGATAYGSSGYYMASNSNTVNGESDRTSSWIVGFAGANLESSVSEILLFSPQVATRRTSIQSRICFWDGTNFGTSQYAGGHTELVSYDSATFFPSTGTFTGTIRVYGFNQ
jgi:hypothetical protein